MRKGRLILTRRQGEAVVIGANITVTVEQINANNTVLAIVAPHSVSVDREEVFKRKQMGAKIAGPRSHGPIR